MKKTHYVLSKSETSGELVYVNYKDKGLKFKPKNNIDYSGVKVNEMVLIKPIFIEKVLKRKIRKQLEMYLQYIIRIIDDDGDDTGDLKIALDELSRYKKTIQNNYRVYLEDRYVELLLKKIKLLENELKTKIINSKIKEKEPEVKTSRRSR